MDSESGCRFIPAAVVGKEGEKCFTQSSRFRICSRKPTQHLLNNGASICAFAAYALMSAGGGAGSGLLMMSGWTRFLRWFTIHFTVAAAR